ncbi:MAG: 50S ribosomal protein L11 methyltransferase [Parachlamydiaceae bacterium]
MTQLYRLSLNPSYSFEQAWNTLEENGIDILYGSQEEGNIELFVHLPSPDCLVDFKWIISCEPHTLPSIDWEAQWAAHGHHFQEGCVNIDLDPSKISGPTLRLQPGSGFGDLSHPTTRLIMDGLKEHLTDQVVIDIGCGSGILTLAAAAMGAPAAFGIDIDPQAIQHSRENALLNQLEMTAHFTLPSDFKWNRQPDPVLILMNMIRTEQLIAWSSLSLLHDQPGEIITSGIRVEERSLYLNQVSNWNWTLLSETEEMGWLAFHFAMNVA